MFKILFVLSTFILSVKSACDNGCSGHGCCGEKSVCECFDNWGIGLSHLSGDCSERICPYELAWVDAPNAVGTFHRYAECANKGICNRGTGECECFPGYEGKACQRTTCPNDCSGHGRCKYIEDFGFGAVPSDYPNAIDEADNYHNRGLATFTYYSWDNYKTRGCVCDPEWGDVDCSKRMCPFGTDIMDQRDDLTSPQKYQVQKIFFQADTTAAAIADKTFALTFKSKLNETFTTNPIKFYKASKGIHEFVLDVENALEQLPNRVIDNVDVHASANAFSNQVYLNITFVGENVQGNQYMLNVESILCANGCTPKLTGLELQVGTNNISQVTLADFNSYECGRRGKCDYTTGICDCFAGYTGQSCSTISCLV